MIKYYLKKNLTDIDMSSNELRTQHMEQNNELRTQHMVSNNELRTQHPNQKNIYGAALALIAIMYGIMQNIIAVASLLATMALYGNGKDPQ